MGALAVLLALCRVCNQDVIRMQARLLGCWRTDVTSRSFSPSAPSICFGRQSWTRALAVLLALCRVCNQDAPALGNRGLETPPRHLRGAWPALVYSSGAGLVAHGCFTCIHRSVGVK